MKQCRITKLYEGLSNKELAALSFHYMAAANELEIERVSAAVPVKTYDCRDVEYQQWVNSFYSVATYWSIEYWKLQAGKLAAIVSLHITLGRGETEKVETIIEVHEGWESRLLALDRALLLVCDEHGIDPKAVRQIAGAEEFHPISTAIVPNNDYQAYMQANFARILRFVN